MKQVTDYRTPRIYWLPHYSEITSNSKSDIIGIDNINDYYDVQLKKDRLKNLKKTSSNFQFRKIDIRNYEGLLN